MLLFVLACNGPDDTRPDPDPEPESGLDSVDSAPEGCGTALGDIDPSWVELSWDDGVGVYDITGQTWTADGVELRDTVLNESVRFELDRPTRIHAFAIAYTNLPADWPEGTEVEAGVYPDFGHNGFDFWHEDPLWTGTRCIEDIEDGGWTTYVLDTPVDTEQPGLVHAAHQRADNTDLAVLFDAGANNTECGSWGDCHSALNTPELGTPTYYPGYSFPFQYDYLIRIYVEYLEDPPEDKVFVDATGELSVGSRQSWGDFDNDGWDDLNTNSRIYRNLGDGTFELTQDLSDSVSASGAVWGDYDNDGCLDLFVFAESTTAGESLWKGDCSGTFIDMTESAGVTDIQDYNLCASDETQNHQPSPAAAWWDLDNDGDLDVYVPDMICWTDWDFYKDQVWLNNGDGTFTEITGEYGFSDWPYSGRGAAPIDADQDGWVDIFINDYTLHKNLFYWNIVGEGGEDWVQEAGVATELAGVKEFGSSYYGHSIGAAWGDLDNDGSFDLIEANLAHPRFWTFSDKTRVMINAGDGTWVDKQGDWDTPYSNESGLRYSETHSVPVLADFDQDGALDLVISATYSGRPTDFYWGNGDGTFELDVLSAGLQDITGAWGVAVSDFDQDGDQDLTITSYLLENTAGTGHWVQVRAIGGVDSNWGAYGATVRVGSGDTTVVRHVTGGTGQGDQDSAYLHFGLGELDTVDVISVDFPGGGTVEYTGPWDADQRIWVFEDGTTATGWEFPS
ncbi:MAG TPA: CRTAC1 family protein [Myxococcota bacterium]|nr:CRTAC1 family protein [Myxococcota bacterium]